MIRGKSLRPVTTQVVRCDDRWGKRSEALGGGALESRGEGMKEIGAPLVQKTDTGRSKDVADIEALKKIQAGELP